MRPIALLTAVLLAACGGSSDANPTTTAPATTTTTTTTRVIVPPERITQQHLGLIGLGDQELPPDLIHLVPGPLPFEGIPKLFLDGNRFGWVGQGYAPLLEEAPQVSVAMRLRESEEQALAQFADGIDAIETGSIPSSHTDISTFDVPEFGEEAIGLHYHRGEGTIQRWETVVVFRDDALIVALTISRVDEVDDAVVIADLASLLDDRLQGVKSGELAPTEHDPFDLSLYRFPTAPQRQLNTFDFEASLSIDGQGEISVSGSYERTNRMRCEVTHGGETRVFFWDGESLAVEDEAGLRLLATEDPLSRLVAACPGHTDFFDRGFPIYWLSLYEIDDTILYEPQVARTEVDGMPVYLYLAENPPNAHRLSSVLERVERVSVMYSELDGWAPRMDVRGEIDAGFLFPEAEGDIESFEMEFSITRANDPTISVDLPDLLGG